MSPAARLLPLRLATVSGTLQELADELHRLGSAQTVAIARCIEDNLASMEDDTEAAVSYERVLESWAKALRAVLAAETLDVAREAVRAALSATDENDLPVSVEPYDEEKDDPHAP